MSLGRSFAYAGVQSLLVSRWQVSDVSAPFIIKYFYEGLKLGMPKSEALKHAQNQFLSNDADNITSSPLYWSGFYVIGNDKPISIPNKWNYWTFLIVGLMMALLVTIFKRRSLNRI